MIEIVDWNRVDSMLVNKAVKPGYYMFRMKNESSRHIFRVNCIFHPTKEWIGAWVANLNFDGDEKQVYLGYLGVIGYDDVVPIFNPSRLWRVNQLKDGSYVIKKEPTAWQT